MTFTIDAEEIVFVLAECRECGTRHAVTPDPHIEQQWLIFDRERMGGFTHILSGRPLCCIFGHTLTVTCIAAVLVDGQWHELERESGGAWQN